MKPAEAFHFGSPLCVVSSTHSAKFYQVILPLVFERLGPWYVEFVGEAG
jgi:hypothetical protein